MTERKNIDRLFQEKFRDFEVDPDEKIWDNIEAELRKKKKRRVIPLWWKLSGVAALLIVGLIVFEKYPWDDQKPEHRVVIDNNAPGQNEPSGNNNSKPENKINNATIPSDQHLQIDAAPESVTENDNSASSPRSEPKPKSRTAVATSDETQANAPERKIDKRSRIDSADEKENVLRNSNTETATVNLKPKDKTKSRTSSTFNTDKSIENYKGVAINSSSEKENGRVNNKVIQSTENNAIDTDKILKDLQGTKLQKDTISISQKAEIKKDSAAIATVAPNALEELLNEKENKVTTKEQKVNRWQITSSVAPIYFSSTSNGSPLDSRFESNKKSYTPSFSYGVGAKYALNKKFSVKAGVNSVAMEYNTIDVVFFQTENARRMENVKPNMPGSMIQVDNKPSGNETTTLGRTITQYNADINQKIGYVELPVEMSYKLVDRKFGVELIGGLSTMILNENEVSIVSSGMDMNIGEAENLNPVHFSTNVGVGFKYSFLKSFQANVEPMFKYQINTFSNDSGNFKPFFFGLYTGISYHF
jgi:hypothetical protein